MLPNEDPAGPGGIPPAADAPRTILIVDDSPVDLRLSAHIVARRPGLRAVTAASGHEALDFIAREPPAAVVTDLQMPDMDGLGLVRAIRADFPGIPVVLMTAFGSEDVAVLALRAGAASYVPKKALRRELADTLVAVLAVTSPDGQRRKLMRCIESTRSRFRIDNDPAMIAPLIALIQEELDGLGLCDGNARTRVGVSLQETLANALYHGNLEVSSELRQEDERVFYAEAEARRRLPPYRDRSIHVEADLDPESATFRIRDEGPGFDTSALDAPFDPESLLRVGGRGMILIRSFMDEVRHNAAGNEITLVKRRTV